MDFRRSFAVSCLAVTVPLVPVFAQSASQPEPPKWSLSLGVDPTHFDLHTPDPGVDARMVANLTRSWQSGNSRFARHVSLMFGTDAPQGFNPSGDPQCDCLMNLRRNYSALTAGASYDLLRASRFTPYVKAGTGIYYIVASRDPSKGFLTPAEVAYYQTDFSHSGFSLGVNGGLGLKLRLGSHEFFIEQMLHRFDVRHSGTGVYPLNIGIRF